MRDQNAQQLLARVMQWEEVDPVREYLPPLQLLANHKYDHYQRFAPGKRFIENLALWLNRFDLADRPAALDFVRDKLVFISESEFSHLVSMAYSDIIAQQRAQLVGDELMIPSHRVAQIWQSPRFHELGIKSLYLGLSDGARTSELRRGSNGGISNEQIWHAYELSPEKIQDMIDELRSALSSSGFSTSTPKFNLIWLLDDFSGSGNTYIRPAETGKGFKGKIKKVYEQLHRGQFVDQKHYEVFLLLYVATRQAIDHIQYWSEQFTSEHGYKPLKLEVIFTIERDVSVASDEQIRAILSNAHYNDPSAADKHFLVGGTDDPRLGFAGCALPLVLAHNTPNNSIFILWGPESSSFVGLFPRVSRHREF
jgi:hypothetical protein